jgi:2,3-bisphosphoglycerate-independent phosphoglycerate mutase
MTKKDFLPMILVILDGWGIGEPNRGNAVTLAKTPTMESITKKYPNTLLCAHGRCAGLPDNQVGNSEAGHTNIGTGRVADQEIVRVSKSIEDGTFYKNTAFIEAIKHVKKNKSRLHLMGLLSNGMSPHSDPVHLQAFLQMAHESGIKDVCLHLFTDGRDSSQHASPKLIERLQAGFYGTEKICTIIGRFYAMDRKKMWSRTEMAYNALVLGEGIEAESAQAAISESYNRGESDEYVKPYVIYENGQPTPRIAENDSVIFFNLRSDRGRQLTKVFVQDSFNVSNPDSFHRKRVLKNMHFVAMTDFGPDLGNLQTAFPGVDWRETLPMQLKDIKQLYAAEAEKYAHVTYFFNGGYSQKVDGEEYFMLPSPDVRSYEEVPGMRSEDLTDAILAKLEEGAGFTVLNFAAPDMIGHTGNLEASIKCCEIVDTCLGRIVDAYLAKGGTVLVTADHGNIERMINLETDEVVTEHTTNPVPFIVVSKKLKKLTLRSGGVLGDIAPTILGHPWL